MSLIEFLSMNVWADEVSVVEVDRILQSDTFRGSEVLRRLFRFLADKAIAGEADGLKEYIIGIDALGKPPSFDPRSDAIVRLQAGRLRKKLAEYYRTEGKDDPVLVDLPKGSFRLTWHTRSEAAATLAPLAGADDRGQRDRGWLIWLLPLLGTALIVLAAWNVRLSSQLRVLEAKDPGLALWTPELHELWDPFISRGQSLLVAFADPIFAGVLNPDGNVVGYLRLTDINDWENVEKSPVVQTLRKAMGSPKLEPRFDLVGRGYLDIVLRLGRLLGTRQPRLSVARLSAITWESLSENNVILVGGKGSTFDRRLTGLPVQEEFSIVDEGVRNVHPRSGEPAIFADSKPAGVDGEVYAVISVLPGPVGITHIGTFASNRFWGNTGAMEWFTDPTFAKFLVDQLKHSTHKLPSFYQIVLKVRYKDGIPTDISYITHRALPGLQVTPAKQ